MISLRRPQRPKDSSRTASLLAHVTVVGLPAINPPCIHEDDMTTTTSREQRPKPPRRRTYGHEIRVTYNDGSFGVNRQVSFEEAIESAIKELRETLREGHHIHSIEVWDSEKQITILSVQHIPTSKRS